METFSKRKIFSPDEKTFTHLEYTGKTENVIKNSEVFQVNREPAHTANTTVVYQNIEAARKGALDYNKETSDYYQLLTGENNDWKLTVVKNAEAA